IQGLPVGHQLAQLAFGIRCAQQRAMPAVLGALQLLRDAGLQVHHTTAACEPLAILLRQHRSAARGEDHAVEPCERIDRFTLALAKARLALLLEDVWDVHARAFLDLGVAVVKRQVEYARQALAHCRLAGAHRADEIHVAVVGGSRSHKKAAASLRPPILWPTRKGGKLEGAAALSTGWRPRAECAASR